MVKIRINILSLLVLMSGMLAFIGCAEDELHCEEQSTTDGILLNIGTPQSSKIDIQTRAYNLDYVDEHRVLNMYVYIFDKSGDKVYSRYFDNSNKKNSADEVKAASTDCWYIANSSDKDTRTAGIVNIHTTVDEDDTYQIYIVTNLDADMVDISSDRLSQIQKESELLNVQGRIRDAQQTLSRNAALQMSGALKNVYIKENGGTVKVTTDTNGSNEAELQLYHLDAKVHVTLIQGVDVKEMTNAEIKLINVPKSSFVFRYEDRIDGVVIDETTSGYDAGNEVEDFFDYGFVSFDEELVVPTDIGGGKTDNRSHYSAYFYMLENRRSPTNEIPVGENRFFERDRQTKYEGGLSDGRNVVNTDGTRDFIYADDLSTYMVIKATISMDLEDTDIGKELGGDVEYIIHLGDFSTNVNNFNTNRNTFYQYTITINGAHNIRVEVDNRDEAVVDGRQPGEDQPSGMGSVVVAKEEIAICDCHYVTKTLSFHANNIEPQLTWCVSTPFGDGQPVVDEDYNEILIPPGLDYEWVHFRLNKKGSDGKYYEKVRQNYTTRKFDSTADPDDEESAYYGLMNVSQLVKFIKDQKKLYLEGLDPADPTNLISSLSAFDKDAEGPKICVTAFIDEFYYDYDPTGMYAADNLPVDFWKKFVNAPRDRYMYILSDSNLSRDQESTATGSVITIQQHPIQTIYDPTLSTDLLKTAWGIEREDEYPDLWRYNEAHTVESRPVITPERYSGNNDQDNGRINSIKEWDLYYSNTSIKEVRWDYFMNYEVENDVPELIDDYKKLRYSCLTRNRDNDGDGVIDQDEIRWYMASIRQLIGISVGQGLLKFDSRLYNRNSTERQSKDNSVWRQHTISSTAYNNNSNNPTVVWGEEMSSTGDLDGSWYYSNTGGNTGRVTKWTVRCVRNLGTKNETKDVGYDLTEIPDSYVTAITNDAYAYDGAKSSITCVYLDDRALRAQSSVELPLTDENREVNRLSKKFYIADTYIESLPDLGDITNNWENHNNRITTFGDSVTAGYCPKGYRVPNQRELMMMFMYFKDMTRTESICRTYYSFGTLGEDNMKKENKVGWSVGGNLYMKNATGNGSGIDRTPRCVRDATLDELAAAGLL